MIRHQKGERTRLSGFNTESWKTDKNIDEIYSKLTEGENEFTSPYEIKEHEKGCEAIFNPVSGNYQINAHEYDEEWKDTEIDFIYLGNLDENTNKMIDFYREEI